MCCRTHANQTPDDGVTLKEARPPYLHIQLSEVTANPATGEIEQLITLHEGVRFVLCYSRPMALRTSVYLDAASEKIKSLEDLKS